ncbi:MAG: ribosomal rRNA E-loop binding protein Ctc/L25/TL5, large subunit ribosomal protein [Candidatus Paceibacter sp.]|jgi:large subunit ribosomal protein L25|nr:ribosomal rRNA E-loop binding protein Ctc/L25/TL5, large subunit ribosomal protein [Candidatus Paceibacter sp.]
MLTIQFETRDTKGTTSALKKAGMVPAVFYGPKEKSTSISVKETEFRKVWKDAGESSIIVLKNGEEEHEALIQDVDVHPVTDTTQHVDFYVIEKGKKLEVSVPLEFVGVSAAVKDLGGILVKVLHELPIEALPKDLPHDIQVDISALSGLDSQILAKDLKLPAGVEIKIEPEDVIAAIAVAKEEVEEAPADISAIEVVGAKGKEEEAAEGPEAGAEEKK